MLNGAAEFAKMLKERENDSPYSPVEGIVAELPDLKIRIDDKNVPGKTMLLSLINLYETDYEGNYVWLGRRVYLLPFFSTKTKSVQKYLVIGGDAI